MIGKELTARQRCELEARDFLSDEHWKALKADYDECMAFRKTLKGKPDELQKLQLKMNADFIAFCDTVLWHSARMALTNECICKACDAKRQQAAKEKA